MVLIIIFLLSAAIAAFAAYLLLGQLMLLIIGIMAGTALTAEIYFNLGDKDE